jgi:hypothetical protein
MGLGAATTCHSVASHDVLESGLLRAADIAKLRLMIIRDAKPSDVEAACDVVRRSITELCTPDHRGDAATLDAWLANKTPEAFAEWATSERHIALVAESNGRIAAYCLLNCSSQYLI